MFWKVTISQIKNLLRKKEAMFVFYILLGLVLYTFVGNVLAYQGKDVIEMYHPMKMMLLSYNRVYQNADKTLLLIQIYPLLVVCPAGFALAKEYQLGEHVYLMARLGARQYKWSKIVAAFFTTMIIFTVPFFIEMMLNCVSFPLTATGDMSGWSFYDRNYLEAIQRYNLSWLYVRNTYVYAFVSILLFGMVSGLLGAFTVAISSLVKVKYSVFLLLPIYILLNFPGMFVTAESLSVSYNWHDYLLLFNDNPKNNLLFVTSILGMIIFIIAATMISSRKDCL